MTTKLNQNVSGSPAIKGIRNKPNLNPNGTVNIGPYVIGQWATLDGKYRLQPNETCVKPFTVKGKGKFLAKIKEVYST